MSGRAWLKDVPWELVVWQNEQLCLAKRAHHGPTSDGYEECRALWEAGVAGEEETEAFRQLCEALGV